MAQGEFIFRMRWPLDPAVYDGETDPQKCVEIEAENLKYMSVPSFIEAMTCDGWGDYREGVEVETEFRGIPDPD